MEKVIFRLNRKHIDVLSDIDAESEHETDKENLTTKKQYLEELSKRFKINHELFFGFKENGILKGYVTIKPFFHGRGNCELYWLAVRKKYQKTGIGTRLTEFAEKISRQMGFRAIYLYTNKVMVKTRMFYEKRGYKLINEFPGYYDYPKNNTAVLYGKKIR